ncbi:hypothetical protein OGZ01_28350 [Vibrio harveyi]|nr:hypothetical protein [Vibrio harveyi]
MDPKETELQDYGFSRLAASELVKKHKDCITFSNGESKLKVDIRKLKSQTTEHSLIGKELNWIAK